MRKWAIAIRISGFLLAVLLIASSPPIKAQSITEVVSNPPPNKQYNVVRESGNCPKNVGIWNISFGYRQDALMSEQIAIADTLPIAGLARLASERFRFVEFQAPLLPAYASCVGEASSPQNPNSLDARYRFRFRNRNVYFSVDFTATPEGFGAGISDRKIIGGRPFVVLQFID